MTDYVDVRELIERAEELETKMAEFLAVACPELEEASLLAAADAGWGDDLVAEAETIRDLLDELRGNGGDEQWRGHWYPVTLIPEDEFEAYMDEMLEDCGDIPKNLPCYLKIEVDYDALRMDYTEVEFRDVTYLYR